MNTTEVVINEIKQLPEPLQREVLNYARFLKHKAEQDSLLKAQLISMEQIWSNEEDEAWNNVPSR
ncbi:conserved hypothetical protein [Desulfonatronospira thiodismutans ASO3-1]|uniref:DUF2281 domain-containing protein n=1 Tax=Desulfonatronospira thiodismutans ASO3-1 TaxID=555779 RepID=D6SLJ0_9BACT|nr:DUF2281 domain-containing protein [Desulfonatronospira thiodismutans]EFI35551.1 conserved hypothetical protein [Desulfonatronospira thiodismutans ASO3-1]